MFTIWKDNTVEVEDTARTEKNQQMRNLHRVVILQYQKSYLEAAKLAFDLDIRR